MKETLRNKLALALVLVFLTASLWACSTQTQSDQTTEAPTTEAATTEAVTEATTEAETEPETYTLSEGSPLATLPEYTYDTWNDYWDMEGGAEMLLYNAENGDGYTQYLADMKAAGFTLYAENEITGNLFSTWTSDEVNVTLMYAPGLKSVRILAEPSMTLPGLEADNVYTDAGVENVVTMVGVDHDGQTGNGMCFIYRLCDGSFIIVDSGFNKVACAEAIYNTLVELAPDPENIVIASWFITHTHSDHVGGFYAFSTAYADKVTLEQVVYNYPTELSYQLTDTSTTHIAKLPQHIAMYGDDVRVIEAHPGQVFYIRDAVIEMLYTWDLYSAKTIIFMNNSSLVFTVNFDDTKIMQLGDCGPIATNILLDMYGDSLKSDIIQVAHHGYIGATAELNSTIDADVVLWPCGQSAYIAHWLDSANKVFQDAPYMYLAETRATVVPIPFNADAVQTWELYGTAQ